MKVICIGKNYVENAEELQRPTEGNPIIFLKPDSAVLKSGGEFSVPDFSDNVFYEIEVVLKISKEGKNISKEDADSYYDEIGVGIDFTAKDIHGELKTKGLPWELSKGFDGSAAISDFYSKEQYNMGDLNFQLYKNKEKVQDGNSSLMIYRPNDIISFVSKYYTLYPGDLIFTGTPPKGVGKILAGDEYEGYLEGEKVFELKIQ